MNDEDIIKQLMQGNHLSTLEEERAKQLIKAFCLRLDIKTDWRG